MNELITITEKKAILDSQMVKDLILVEKQIKELKESPKEIIILELEETFKHYLEINGTKVLVKGQIDRIDEVDGQCRIIDYKSGAVTEKDLEGSTVEEDITKLKEKWLQLMIYAWLYNRDKNHIPKHDSGKPVEAGIYPLRNFSADLMKVKIVNDRTNHPNKITLEILDDIEAILHRLIGEIQHVSYVEAGGREVSSSRNHLFLQHHHTWQYQCNV